MILDLPLSDCISSLKVFKGLQDKIREGRKHERERKKEGRKDRKIESKRKKERRMNEVERK